RKDKGNMIITAEQMNTRQTPTRLRLVAKAVKKMSVENAMDQLKFMDKKASVVMEKVFKQAVANATKNMGLSLDSLTIKDIIVGEGPRYKRFQAVSRGRAHSILKRTSHVRVILESKKEGLKTQTTVKTVSVRKTGER